MNQQLLPIKVFFRVIGTVVVVAALIFLVLAFFFKLDAGAALVAGMIGGLVVLKLQGWYHLFMWLFRTATKKPSYCASCHQPVDPQWKRCSNCGATWQ